MCCLFTLHAPRLHCMSHLCFQGRSEARSEKIPFLRPHCSSIVAPIWVSAGQGSQMSPYGTAFGAPGTEVRVFPPSAHRHHVLNILGCARNRPGFLLFWPGFSEACCSTTLCVAVLRWMRGKHDVHCEEVTDEAKLHHLHCMCPCASYV